MEGRGECVRGRGDIRNGGQRSPASEHVWGAMRVALALYRPPCPSCPVGPSGPGRRITRLTATALRWLRL